MMYIETAGAHFPEQEIVKIYNCYLRWHAQHMPDHTPVMITAMNSPKVRAYIYKRALEMGYGTAAPEPRWEPLLGKVLVRLGLATWADEAVPSYNRKDLGMTYKSKTPLLPLDNNI